MIKLRLESWSGDRRTVDRKRCRWTFVFDPAGRFNIVLIERSSSKHLFVLHAVTDLLVQSSLFVIILSVIIFVYLTICL